VSKQDLTVGTRFSTPHKRGGLGARRRRLQELDSLIEQLDAALMLDRGNDKVEVELCSTVAMTKWRWNFAWESMA
jgi:hypothetical protein